MATGSQLSKSSFNNNTDYVHLLNDEMANNLLPLIVICTFFMCIGFSGNCLVVCIYLLKIRRSAKRTFILALALLDLSVCLIVIPFEIYDLRNQMVFNHDWVCKAIRVLEYSAVLSAGFVLVSVSFERYHFLCKAFTEFTSRKAKIVCISCVILAVVIATPAVRFAGLKTRHVVMNGRNVTGCECSMNSADNNSDDIMKRVYYYFLAAVFLGCFVVFIVIYSIIGNLLWKYQKGTLVYTVSRKDSPKKIKLGTKEKQISIEHSSELGKSQSSSCFARLTMHGRRKTIKSARSVVIFFSVTLVFMCSFLPHIIIRLLQFLNVQVISSNDMGSGELLYNFIVRSYMISNVINPFIYSILNTEFRNELKRMVYKVRTKCGRNRRDSFTI